MTNEEKLAEAKKLKSEGVEKYKEGDITSARDLFARAISHLEKMKDKESINLYATTLSNLCNCCNRKKDYYAVINFATKGLNVKILPKLYYFRAIAYSNIFEFENAKKDLESLKNILGEKERENDEGVKFINNLIEKKKKEISPPKEQNIKNPVIFFDIKIGKKKPKRIEIELFKNKFPKICEKFRCICTGEKGEKMNYKGKRLYKIIKNSIIQVGNIENVDNKGDSSENHIKFRNENFFYSHSRKGLLSICPCNIDIYDYSQFFITLKEALWLDKKNIVFGQIIKGIDILEEIEVLKTDSQDKLKTNIFICDCGEFKNEITIKYEINDKDFELILF